MDEKQAEGKITEISEVGSGNKQDGTPWTRYKYKIGNRTYSGFIDLKKREINLNEYVLVSYTEKEDTYDGKPITFKNVVNITKGVAPKDLEESERQHHVVPVGTQPKAIDYNAGAFFGMVFNKTVEEIIANPELNLDAHFDSIFEKLWRLATEKRKEKFT